VSDDPGRIIYNLEQRLEAAKNRNRQGQEQLAQRHQTINDQATEIDRLKAEWQSEFTAAQKLRSEVAQLERLLGEAREELQQLQADQAADEQHSEGERAAYLEMIKALWEMRS
jgi:predicted RNase H-like nuclease (RuvC/YqgF family)